LDDDDECAGGAEVMLINDAIDDDFIFPKTVHFQQDVQPCETELHDTSRVLMFYKNNI